MDPAELTLTLPVSLDDMLADVLDGVQLTEPEQVAGGILTLGDVWNKVKDIWDAVRQFLVFLNHPGRFSGWFTDRFLDIFRWIGDKASWLQQNLWDAANGTVAWVVDRSRWVQRNLWDAANGVVDWVVDRARWVQQNLWDAANGMTAWVIDRARWLWDNLSPLFRRVLDWVTDRTGWLQRNLWNAAEGLTAWVVDRSRWLWNLLWPTLQNVISESWDSARWLWEHTSDSMAIAWNNTRDFFVDTTTTVIETGNTIIRETGNAVIAGAQGIGDFFQSGLDWLFNHVFDPVRDAIRVKMGIPRKLLKGEYTSLDELLDDFEDPLPTGSIVGLLWTVASAPFALISAMTETGSIMAQETVQVMAKGIGLTIPSFNDLRDGYLRGLIDEATHDDWLGRSGFSADNIDLIKQLYFDLPTQSDMVRMAVREVFSSDVVRRFGLFDEFPDDFATFAEQIGISREWAERHWGAHWDLPSVTQGFAMFHRDVIDRGTLDLLLRTKDVMPFWRDKLTDIAFRVVSRIDIRRMFRHGVVDRARVRRVYLDLGYAPEDAEALTEFVVRDAAGADKDLPRGTIERAYQDRLLTRTQASTELAELGFSADQVEMFLDMVDFRVETQLAGLAEDIVERDFKAGAILEGSARSQLRQLGVPDDRVDLLLDLWSRQIAVKDRALTPSQDLRLFRAGIISEPVVRDRLGRLGYNETDIGYLIELADPEEAPPEPRELTKADLRAALSDGVLAELQVRDRLREKGYNDADVNVLVATWTAP